jgi:hypothetical protein
VTLQAAVDLGPANAALLVAAGFLAGAVNAVAGANGVLGPLPRGAEKLMGAAGFEPATSRV